MKNKLITKITSLILLALLTISLASCNKAPEGLLEALPSLIENSRELEYIVYGEGLKADAERGEIGSVYKAVSADEKYQSKDQIVAEMDKYFTDAYIEVMCINAFSGISNDSGFVTSRYIEYEGMLYVDSSYESQAVMRQPNYDSIEVIKSNKSMAEVSILMTEMSGSVVKETFLAKFEDEKWKLDSPIM